MSAKLFLPWSKRKQLIEPQFGNHDYEIHAARARVSAAVKVHTLVVVCTLGPCNYALASKLLGFEIA